MSVQISTNLLKLSNPLLNRKIKDYKAFSSISSYIAYINTEINILTMYKVQENDLLAWFVEEAEIAEKQNDQARLSKVTLEIILITSNLEALDKKISLLEEVKQEAKEKKRELIEQTSVINARDRLCTEIQRLVQIVKKIEVKINLYKIGKATLEEDEDHGQVYEVETLEELESKLVYYKSRIDKLNVLQLM